LLANQFKKDYDITFVSCFVSEDCIKKLEHFKIISLGKRPLLPESLATFEGLLRRSEFKSMDTNEIILNFSQCFLANAHIYYAQGPITRALDDIQSLKGIYRYSYKLARPFLVKRDRSFNEKLRVLSRLFIANSTFCTSMYECWGIKVDGIIYPPLDCEAFKPMNPRPSEDYALTYFGKETKYS
jgi:hypothetical protein